MRRITERYADCMAQFVTRIDDDLTAAVDRLIAAGGAESRSDAVRKGLAMLIRDHHRRTTATAIVEGYRHLPQTESELPWADQATIRMISEEPW